MIHPHHTLSCQAFGGKKRRQSVARCILLGKPQREAVIPETASLVPSAEAMTVSHLLLISLIHSYAAPTAFLHETDPEMLQMSQSFCPVFFLNK